MGGGDGERGGVGDNEGEGTSSSELSSSEKFSFSFLFFKGDGGSCIFIFLGSGDIKSAKFRFLVRSDSKEAERNSAQKLPVGGPVPFHRTLKISACVRLQSLPLVVSTLHLCRAFDYQVPKTERSFLI